MSELGGEILGRAYFEDSQLVIVHCHSLFKKSTEIIKVFFILAFVNMEID